MIGYLGSDRSGSIALLAEVTGILGRLTDSMTWSWRAGLFRSLPLTQTVHRWSISDAGQERVLRHLPVQASRSMPWYSVAFRSTRICPSTLLPALLMGLNRELDDEIRFSPQYGTQHLAQLIVDAWNSADVRHIMRAPGHCCRLSRGPNRKLGTRIGSSPIGGGGIGCTPGSWNHGNLGTPPFSYECRCIPSAADAPVMHQIGDWAAESYSAQWITTEPTCDQAPRIPYALVIGHFHTHAGLFRFPRMHLLCTKSKIKARDWIWSAPSTRDELKGNSPGFWNRWIPPFLVLDEHCVSAALTVCSD